MAPRESEKRNIKRGRRKNPQILFYGVLFSILLLSLNLVNPSLTNFLHYRFYDLLLSANQGKSSSVPIIVDIDEKSLRQHGQWPWPRYRMAILLDKLRDQGALRIGLDMRLAEEDRASIHYPRH